MYSFCGKKFRTTLADTICCRNRRGLKTRSFTLTTRTGQSSRNQWNSHTIHSGTKKSSSNQTQKFIIIILATECWPLARNSQDSNQSKHSSNTWFHPIFLCQFIRSFIFTVICTFSQFILIFQNWNSVFDNFRKSIIRLRTVIGGWKPLNKSCFKKSYEEKQRWRIASENKIFKWADDGSKRIRELILITAYFTAFNFVKMFEVSKPFCSNRVMQ